MKRIIALLMTLVLLFCGATPTLAATPEDISPLYLQTSQASISFVILEDGTAEWTIVCMGYSTAESITAVSYLERKVGSVWFRVNMEAPENEYTYTVQASDMFKAYTMQLTRSGTYRAFVELTVRGANGNDYIELYNEYDYYP